MNAMSSSCTRINQKLLPVQSSSLRLAHFSGLFVNVRSLSAFAAVNSLTSTLYENQSLSLANSQHPQYMSQTRQFASKRKMQNKSKDDNSLLLNEHLIANLLTGHVTNKKKGGSEHNAKDISAETFEVRLIVDLGRNANNKNNNPSSDSDDDDDSDGDDEGSDDDEQSSPSSSGPTSQITSLMEAINIANEHNLDLMEVMLKQNPPVIKAVDYDKWLYDSKKKEKAAGSNSGGGGAISDKALKEFKFRAGIADHDLQRKTEGLIKYLAKGHAIRVTLTARQRALNVDGKAIDTTLDRVKELVGDRAVEVRAMKSNDRRSYGSLLLHPNKSSKD